MQLQGIEARPEVRKDPGQVGLVKIVIPTVEIDQDKLGLCGGIFPAFGQFHTATPQFCVEVFQNHIRVLLLGGIQQWGHRRSLGSADIHTVIAAQGFDFCLLLGAGLRGQHHQTTGIDTAPGGQIRRDYSVGEGGVGILAGVVANQRRRTRRILI